MTISQLSTVLSSHKVDIYSEKKCDKSKAIPQNCTTRSNRQTVDLFEASLSVYPQRPLFPEEPLNTSHCTI